MTSFTSILALWPSRQEVRRDLGSRGFPLSTMAVNRWAEREYIPPFYWPALLSAADARGITLENQQFLDAMSAAIKRRKQRKSA